MQLQKPKIQVYNIYLAHEVYNRDIKVLIEIIIFKIGMSSFFLFCFVPFCSKRKVIQHFAFICVERDKYLLYLIRRQITI